MAETIKQLKTLTNKLNKMDVKEDMLYGFNTLDEFKEFDAIHKEFYETSIKLAAKMNKVYLETLDIFYQNISNYKSKHYMKVMVVKKNLDKSLENFDVDEKEIIKLHKAYHEELKSYEEAKKHCDCSSDVYKFKSNVAFKMQTHFYNFLI
jgi:hypothetical protein